MGAPGTTPGPWAWFGNAKMNEIYLATTHSGRRYVMGFQRWGMRGAQPMFQPAGAGLKPASELVTFEVGNRSVRGWDEARADDSVYRYDISGIDCADAYQIAASGAMYDALNNAAEFLQFYFCGAQAERHREVEGSVNMTAEAKTAIGVALAALALARGEAK